MNDKRGLTHSSTGARGMGGISTGQNMICMSTDRSDLQCSPLSTTYTKSESDDLDDASLGTEMHPPLFFFNRRKTV